MFIIDAVVFSIGVAGATFMLWTLFQMVKETIQELK